MFKSKLSLLAMVLLVVVVGAGVAFAGDGPTPAATQSGDQGVSSDAMMYWLTGSEPPIWLQPQDMKTGPVTGISLDCTRYNNSYCLYKLDKPNWCCRPYWIAPGAYCPQICI